VAIGDQDCGRVAVTVSGMLEGNVLQIGVGRRTISCAGEKPCGDSNQGPTSQTSQLVQAMAGFGGGSGAAENLNAARLSTDTSQQMLLSTPQHA